jgi:hypothetical protein
MDYYNEAGQKIDESEADLTKGYLDMDQLFVAHHDEVPAQEQVSHYEVSKFYFADGTSYAPESQDDPHINKVDADNGVFTYASQEGEEEKSCQGIDLSQITDVEQADAVEAYDEYKEIYRYILYTEEELEKIQQQKEKQEAQQTFLEDGPDQLNTNTTSIEDLTLLVSDIIGGESE